MSENPSIAHPIASRIREMRESLDLSPAEVASQVGLSEEAYLAYEKDASALPISTLHDIAGVFGMDFTTLLTGEAPRMGGYTLCRKGHGIVVNRNPQYHFESLAFNFKGRTMEPLVVTLTPGEAPAAPVTHGGQEFNLVLEGRMSVVIGRHEFTLDAGDSIYFDPTLPHGQYALDVPAKFLTVIQ